MKDNGIGCDPKLSGTGEFDELILSTPVVGIAKAVERGQRQ